MSQRLRRMADQVQRELADLIRMEIKDPRLQGMVTISAVKVSPDLGYADVYITVLGRELNSEDEASANQAAVSVLNGAAGFLKIELRKRIKTRVTPRLRFHYDNVTSHGNYMAGLIAQAMEDVVPEEEETSAGDQT